MTLTVLMAFSAIAGILAGYLSARLGPRWLFPVIVTASVIGVLCLWGWSLVAPATDPFFVVIVVVGIAGPLVGGMVLAGIIGVIARRIITQQEARE